ncbi:LOW QUALITY PROTEIN: hypothetical protein HID58_079055 [Brassica napus]|uniref:Uncharacterized protein n=1 Tax=Brassica napus TaxID=3708 RepID=A0ABQ7Y105_BRANA|nr:LOW QUALITY PROTEIN: hypothetical protein HID58_079055 [Brassica napus]
MDKAGACQSLFEYDASMLEEDYGLAKSAMNVYEKTKEIWRGKRRAEETRFHRRLNGSSCPKHLPQLYQKMVECNSGL